MITLIHGAEGYLIDRAAQELVQPLRSGLTLEFNYEDIQADALTADAFAEKAGTLPFIDPLRVLVLRDWGLLTGKRDKGSGAERAAAYFEGIPDTTQLVMVAHQGDRGDGKGQARCRPAFRVAAAIRSRRLGAQAGRGTRAHDHSHGRADAARAITAGPAPARPGDRQARDLFIAVDAYRGGSRPGACERHP
ncbi:MAG: hypothetical protein E6I78_12065 [Chloroflexi bacterium]|nr:MAG: hypothetical protein E6I78_12065 [Chloroflexota bacterium]